MEEEDGISKTALKWMDSQGGVCRGGMKVGIHDIYNSVWRLEEEP
jgi:hypothetical protein